MRTLGERTWDEASEVEWLPNGRGLLLVARDRSLSAVPQIWPVDYPSGVGPPPDERRGGVDLDCRSLLRRQDPRFGEG